MEHFNTAPNISLNYLPFMDFSIIIRYIPLAFFLLKDKSEQTYTSTFNVLNTLCLKIDCNFNPNIIYIDFEKAIHNSITCIDVYGQIFL